MADEVITVATKNNQFFKIKQLIYEKLCMDFNDGDNIDLSLYSSLFSMTMTMGFTLEETLEAALITNTTNNNDVAALADYLLAPTSSRQARYAQTLQDLNSHKFTRKRRAKQSVDEAMDLTKKMKDIVFAYINQLQRDSFPRHDPFSIMPFDVQQIILEFYSKRFEYKADFDERGIVYWLGCNYGISSWINPALRGLIEITASSIMSDCAPLYSVVGRKLVRWVTKPLPNQWIMIEFMDIAIIPTHYSLRHYSTWDGEALRNWRLEGGNHCSETEGEWICLSWHADDASLNKRGVAHTWKIAKQYTSEAFSQFRIFQHDKNSNFHDYLALSGFEIYGSITARRNAVNTRGQIASVHHKRYALARGFRRNFEHCSDFDTNGLLYFMGVIGGSEKCYDNPAKLGVVNVTSCDVKESIKDAAADSLNAFVGRKTVHCRTNWCAKPWMAVDLKGVKIKLKAYTLRHYSAFDTEALRYWNIEGSNDGIRWIIIQQHLNDSTLCKAGQAHTWSVNADQYFSHFRIFMLDRNSNHHFYLACSGIELYGNAFGGIVSEYYDLNIKEIQQLNQEREYWSCDKCTFVNSGDRIACQMCEAPEPQISPPKKTKK